MEGSCGLNTGCTEGMALILVDEEVADLGVTRVMASGEQNVSSHVLSELCRHLLRSQILGSSKEEARLGEIGGNQGGEGGEFFQEGLEKCPVLVRGSR